MKRFRDIVMSESAPNTQNLWLDKGELKYFSSEGWVPLYVSNATTSITSLDDEDKQELETKVDSLDKEVGEIKRDLTVLGATQKVIELEIGDSSDTKASNLKKLKAIQTNDHTFFTDINYGYGTASWLPTTGGNAFIITNEGHAVKYSITSEGEVSKVSEFTLNNYTLPAATKTTIGGVKAGINIVNISDVNNATTPQVAGVVNTLLNQLRAAGILQS